MTAPTIPTSPEELEEFMHDEARFGALVAGLAEGNGDPLKDLVHGYADGYLKKHAELGKQAEELMQSELRKFLMDNGAGDLGKLDMSDVRKARQGWNGSLTNQDKGQRYNPKAPGARRTRRSPATPSSFRRRGTATLARRTWTTCGRRWRIHQKIVREIRNAAGSTVPSDGGFLIPEILRSEIFQLALTDAVARPHSTVIPMDSLTVRSRPSTKRRA